MSNWSQFSYFYFSNFFFHDRERRRRKRKNHNKLSLDTVLSWSVLLVLRKENFPFSFANGGPCTMWHTSENWKVGMESGRTVPAQELLPFYQWKCDDIWFLGSTAVCFVRCWTFHEDVITCRNSLSRWMHGKARNDEVFTSEQFSIGQQLLQAELISSCN